MKYALISDIHANLEALVAVLRDIEAQQADEIHCLGDVIGYGCDPVACLKLVGELCEVKLLGNHEYAVLGLLSDENMNQLARESMHWTIGQLSDHELSVIADYEMEAQRPGCRLVHASPCEPNRWHYILTMDEATVAFENFDEPLCFFGHTHVPAIYNLSQDGRIRHQTGHDFDPDEEARYLVNVGSVGQPRDHDARASYVLYDTEMKSISYRRVAYDIAATQIKMKAAQMPDKLIERLEVGR